LNALPDALDLKGVFIAALLEKFMPILPSYILFPAIGMGASGFFSLLTRGAIATFGSVGGAAIWYLVGASIGPARARYLTLRFGRWIGLAPHVCDRMTASYKHHAFLITAAGQLVPTVRIFQALPAGFLRLPPLPFLAATAVGSTCWVLPMTFAGYLLRRHGYNAAEAGLGVLTTLLLVEGAAFLTLRQMSERKRRQFAEKGA
jgi:membrane protein DedA with SNARE-associated domain